MGQDPDRKLAYHAYCWAPRVASLEKECHALRAEIERIRAAAGMMRRQRNRKDWPSSWGQGYANAGEAILKLLNGS